MARPSTSGPSGPTIVGGSSRSSSGSARAVDLLPLLRSEEAAHRRRAAPVHGARRHRAGGARGDAPARRRRADHRGRRAMRARPRGPRTGPTSRSPWTTPGRGGASVRCSSSTWPWSRAATASPSSRPTSSARTTACCTSSARAASACSARSRAASSTCASRRTRPRPSAWRTCAGIARPPPRACARCSSRGRWRWSARRDDRAASAPRCCDNLRAAGFTGALHLPRATRRRTRSTGCRIHRSVSAIGAPIDLAVVAVPAAGVPDVVRDCAHAGVRGVVVISCGFAEVSPEGRAAQRRLVRARARVGDAHRRAQLPGRLEYGRRRSAERHLRAHVAPRGQRRHALAERRARHRHPRLRSRAQHRASRASSRSATRPTSRATT